MRKIILIFIAVVMTFLLFRFAGLVPSEFEGPAFPQSGLSERLRKWNVTIDVDDFELTDFSQSSNGGLSKEYVEAEVSPARAEGGKRTLQMTKITTSAPQKYIADKKFLLESLFLPTTSPYPGVITNIRECPKEFTPSEQTHESGTIYTLYAGSRLNYGVCAQDLVQYHSGYGIFDCKDKGVFEVRLFSKTEEGVQQLIQSFSCG